VRSQPIHDPGPGMPVIRTSLGREMLFIASTPDHLFECGCPTVPELIPVVSAVDQRWHIARKEDARIAVTGAPRLAGSARAVAAGRGEQRIVEEETFAELPLGERRRIGRGNERRRV